MHGSAGSRPSPRRVGGPVRVRRRALGALACALAALALIASPASAQKSLVPALPVPVPLPVPLSVEVVAADGSSSPRPTGTITFTGLGLKLLTREVGSTTDMTVVAAGLAALGTNVTLTYSGDRNYEASPPVRVRVPGDSVVTITARRKDTVAPVIEILSPADGVTYRNGESVVAVYSCTDPDGHSDVTRCEGPVAAGAAVDTTRAGRHSFTVTATDASANSDTKTITYAVGEAARAPAAAPRKSDTSGGGGEDAAVPASPQPADDPDATPVSLADEPGSEASPGPGSGPVDEPSGSALAGAPGAGAPGGQASSPSEARPARQAFAPYDPRSEPVQTVGILVAAFTLLQVAMAGGGLALARGGGGVGRSGSGSGTDGPSESKDDEGSGPEASVDYEGVDIEHLGGAAAVVAIGDRSRTWGWPGTKTIDAVGAALPARLSRRSPLLARLTADGTYLRAILGSAWLLAPLAGVALGFAALQDVDGEAIPPAATLAIAIAMLGVLDAMAGLVAVLIFTTGVLALGGIDSNANLRLMLGLAALWTVVPVLAGAIRPLRREPTRTLEQSWDRAADFVIASLIGAWAVQNIVLALPGLAGVELPLTEYANTAAYCVLAALVVRLGLETLAAHLYPWRLDVTEPGELPEPSALQRLGATATRTGIFVFFAYIVVGSRWQLWVGAALFVIPQILAVYEERVPNSPGLFRALPKGLVELVLMLLVGTAVGALLLSTMDENAETFVANSFVLLSLPGFVLSLLQLFGREGDEPRIGWGKRFGGVGLLALGVLLALGLVL